MTTSTQIDPWEQQTDLFNSDLAKFILASNEIHGILNTDFYLEPIIGDEGGGKLVGLFRGLGSECPAVLVLVARKGAWLIADFALIKDFDVVTKLQKVAESYELDWYFDSNEMDGAMKHYVDTILGDMWLTA